MTQKVGLPSIDKNNIKYKVIEGLESKFDEIGPLRVPIIFGTDYPSSATNATNATGDTLPYRRIIVKRAMTRPQNYAVGDVYAGQSFLDPVECATWDGPSPKDEFVDVVGEGWFETTTVEISIWTRESDDRDNIVELVKMLMLELTHRNLQNGAPYFYNNKIYGVQFLKAYEGQDTKIIADQIHYVGVLEYNLSYPVYGTTVEEYTKLKISLTGIIENYEPDKPVIIIDTNNPKVTPPSGGGGGGDTNVTPDIPPDEYIWVKEPPYGDITKQDKNKEILYVGGPLKTDGGALTEQIKNKGK